MPTLPLATLDGFDLTYPIGVSDLAELAGSPFDVEAFRSTPVMLVQGALDDNDPVGERDSFSDDQTRLIRRLFGVLPIDRVGRILSVLDSAGFTNITYRIYPDEPHTMSARFFAEARAWLSPHVSAN
jgi:hypothetical protein